MKELLANFDLFRGLSAAELEAVAKSFATRAHRKGDYLFHEDEAATSLFLIQSGKLKLVKHTPQGKDVIVDIAASWEAPALEPLFDGGRFPTSAICVEPTQVFIADKRQFLKLLDQFPALQKNALRLLSLRSREQTRHIKELSVGKVDARIASLILRLGRKIGQGGRDDKVKIDIHLSRQDIADFTGTTVETAIRTMSRFSKNGLVSTSKDSIFIEDMEQLREVAEM